MTFGVQDFHDLVRLVEQHPEWRAELRRLVLTEELLGLPMIVRELAEAQRRAEERLSGVEDRLAGVEDRLAGVEDRLAGVEDRLAGVEDRLAGVEDRLARLEAVVVELAEAQRRTEVRVDRLEQHVADLRGSDRERRYREHADAYFGRLLRRVRVVSAAELDDLLDEGLASGAFDEDTFQDVRWADLIVRGRRPGEDQETYLVVEVSVAVDANDVVRATRRATVLGRVRPARAVVAGGGLTPEAATLAESSGVWHVLDGRAVTPPPTA